MSTFLHSLICCHCNKAYFSTCRGCKNDHTFTKFFFQLISKITKTIHIYIIYFCSNQFYTFYFCNLIRYISHCLFCHLTLYALKLAVKLFILSLKMTDLIR